jgi:NCS1 family nucleobase:cation symporter-1
VGGAILPMLAGALGAAAIKGFAASPSAAMGHLFPGVGGLILFLLFLGTLPANYTNPYGGFLAATTAFTKTGKVMPTVTLRVLATTAVMAIAVLIGIAASTNFITNLTNYLALILVALVPWTAINLTDFYLVRRGNYEVGEFFKIHGVYGAFNTLAVVIFLVTIGIEIPFLNTTVYEGPIAKNVLGGGDISWIVGFFFAAIVYYVLVPKPKEVPVTGVEKPRVGVVAK